MNKCIKCDEKQYAAKLCKKCYTIAFKENKKNISERFTLR